MLIVSWIYSDFFISLAAALGLAIQIAISFGYKASIDAYLEFATKDYVLHQIHDLALLKSNLNDKTLSLLVDVSTMALLVFPFALVYVILIFLRWLKVKRPLRVGNTETVTYLRDGSLNPKKKNVDRLSQQHRWKFNARREKVSAKKIPSGLVLWSIFVFFVSAYWLYSNRLPEIDKNLIGQTHKETIKNEQNILEGRITHVRDGDTFEINGQAIRISALDCPENSTAEVSSSTLLRTITRTEQSPTLFGHTYTQLYRTREVQWKEQGWMDLWASEAGRTDKRADILNISRSHDI